MSLAQDQRPLIVHVVYRFDVGGLENGIVNLINNMPDDRYRHAIIALTEVTEFRRRIRRADVQYFSLNKPPGQGFKLYPRLFRLFRELKPAITHTRNLGALEAVVPAWAAGVPIRVHGEHGYDVSDPTGSNPKYQWLRRLYRPFVSRYIALSKDLAGYLINRVGMPVARVAQVYNGVDTRRFYPASAGRESIAGCPFSDPDLFLVATVGRMQTIKDQPNLVRAFIRALTLAPHLKARARLILVGDGPLRAQCQALLDEAGLAELAWLPGERNDVPDLLRGVNLFVLPSLAEGISNSILESMACGLPVLATDVGGNSELIDLGVTGEVVPKADSEALAHGLVRWLSDPDAARNAGLAGRRRVEALFSMEAMVSGYCNVYDVLLGKSGLGAKGARQT